MAYPSRKHPSMYHPYFAQVITKSRSKGGQEAFEPVGEESLSPSAGGLQ